MIAIALFLTSFALLIFILHPLIKKWIDVGIKQYEAEKAKEPKVCAHTETTLLSYWIDEDGKMRKTNYCETCGKLVRGSEIEKATRQSS